MQNAVRISSTKPQDVALAQQSKLCVVRSNAYAMLANGAEEEEIRGAISSQLAGEIPAALALVNHELFPVSQLGTGDLEQVFGEVAAFVKITGGGWPSEQRQEFIDQAMIEFADLPVSLLIPALRAARRKVTWAREFVAWVFEAVERDLGKLEAERDNLARLAEISGTKG